MKSFVGLGFQLVKGYDGFSFAADLLILTYTVLSSNNELQKLSLDIFTR